MGLSNTKEKAEKFLELLAKWEKLTADMPTDYKTLGDLYKKEIFSKLDMEKLYK